jgi:hypothetical protein
MEQNFNRVTLCGTVAGEPYLSHINHAESFYKSPLDVPRLSGQCDRLTVVTPGKLLEQTPIAGGNTVRLVGQLRSFNNKSGQGRRLVISVFARRLEVGEGSRRTASSSPASSASSPSSGARRWAVISATSFWR